MADKIVVCKECGEDFAFTEGEQQFYHEKGFTEPKKCPDCRRKDKKRDNVVRR